MSESKTLTLHTNQEEEYPAIMRENTVCSRTLYNYTCTTVCIVCTQNHSNTIIYLHVQYVVTILR